MKKIAILASGSGSNAENIYNYFRNSKKVKIELILTNNKNAFVIERAKKLGIKCQIFSKQELKSNYVLDILQKNNVDFVVLAGFLLLIPSNIIEKYTNKIINIHPALLPKYGGKGMYGDIVHKAVIENKEKESGITIHYVNEKYDEGAIIFQAKYNIETTDTAELLAKKIHKLEYEHFPKVIDELIR